MMKLVGDSALRFADFDTAKKCYNELSMRKIDVQDFNWKNYMDCYISESCAEYLQGHEKNDLQRQLVVPNLTHGNDPAAFSLFMSKVCGDEVDLNTSMAYSLLMACSTTDKSDTLSESFLNKAEHLLLKSNKPFLALSFRIDSLDWSTASVLAQRISSPFVRAEILIQQAGELESKQ